MLLTELLPDDDLSLLESSIKNKLGSAALAGALSTGVMGSIAYNPSQSASYQKQQSIQHQEPSHEVPELPAIKQKIDTHNNFPDELDNQKNKSPQERISTFVNTFVPIIRQANNRIAVQRQMLKHITRPGYDRSENEITWINKLMKYYNASSVKDLLVRLDEIPVSMALAQAAIESGWGTSDIARKGNAFFGQKAWTDKNSIKVSQNERYSAFDNPAESVAGYIYNLNTHPAYQDFRNHRLKLRQNKKPLTGLELIGNLKKYSTKGQGYIDQVSSLLKTDQFKKLD